MQTIAEKIKKLRELRNFTQDYMADKLSLSQSAYSRIESGQTELTFSNLEEIAKLLDVSIEGLIRFDEQRYFNSFNNVEGSNNGAIIINPDYQDLKRLYEDKIKLLEDKIKLLSQN